MANTLIPAKDVGKELMKSFHDAIQKTRPDLVVGSYEYMEFMHQSICYVFGHPFTIQIKKPLEPKNEI